MAESGGGPGCFDWRAIGFSSLKLASLSSEDANLTAPLISPSPNFSDNFFRNVAKDTSLELGSRLPPLMSHMRTCRNGILLHQQLLLNTGRQGFVTMISFWYP